MSTLDKRLTVELAIPAAPGELTGEWLTQALRETGTISHAAVESFDSETIGQGVGLIGELARVSLRYDRPEAGAPSSLIAKFPASAPENREVGLHFRFYEREIRFYEEIAHRVELRTPRRYYSAMDVDADRYVLLLEDLAPNRVGDQLASCSLEEAELAIRHLAQFQAGWWESPQLMEIDWMPLVNDPVNTSAEESYQEAWEPFLERFGDKLHGPMLSLAERLGNNVARMLDGLAHPPRTIIHGDYRLDNLVFGAPQGQDPLTVIDWQISSRGRGVFDVAYFMSTNLLPERRRASEMELLRVYHHILSERGARGYTFEQCLRDYRACTLFCLVYCVISGGTLDLANERGLALAIAMLERNLAAIADLDAGEMLPG